MESKNQPQQPVPQVPVGQPVLPNSTAALVLGIISIPTCSCYGIPGLACGIIAIIFGSKAVKLYKVNPGVYTLSSYNNANAGKICGIIGVSLSALFVLYVIIIAVIWGTVMTSVFSGIPWDQVK
jgi:hypothetical protein